MHAGFSKSSQSKVMPLSIQWESEKKTPRFKIN